MSSLLDSVKTTFSTSSDHDEQDSSDTRNLFAEVGCEKHLSGGPKIFGNHV